jgi:hypothetical protein
LEQDPAVALLSGVSVCGAIRVAMLAELARDLPPRAQHIAYPNRTRVGEPSSQGDACVEDDVGR